MASLPQGVLFVCSSVKEAELSSRQGWTGSSRLEEVERTEDRGQRGRGHRAIVVLKVEPKARFIFDVNDVYASTHSCYVSTDPRFPTVCQTGGLKTIPISMKAQIDPGQRGRKLNSVNKDDVNRQRNSV